MERDQAVVYQGIFEQNRVWRRTESIPSKRGRLPSGSVAFGEHTIETMKKIWNFIWITFIQPGEAWICKTRSLIGLFPVFNGMSRKAFMRLIGMAEREGRIQRLCWE